MPGTVHPRSGPRTRQSEAERRVYEALEARLPDGSTAWHSLRPRAGAAWEGSVLVVEVKGGSIELRDGRWLQNGEPMAWAPRDQAQSFARALVEAVGRRGGEPRRGASPAAFPTASAPTTRPPRPETSRASASEGDDSGESPRRSRSRPTNPAGTGSGTGG